MILLDKVLFSIAVFVIGVWIYVGVDYLFFRDNQPENVGCYHVVDVSGHDWYFDTQPKYDLNVKAIPFDTGNSVGWVWPASIEASYDCTEQPVAS